MRNPVLNAETNTTRILVFFSSFFHFHFLRRKKGGFFVFILIICILRLVVPRAYLHVDVRCAMYFMFAYHSTSATSATRLNVNVLRELMNKIGNIFHLVAGGDGGYLSISYRYPLHVRKCHTLFFFICFFSFGNRSNLVTYQNAANVTKALTLIDII